MRAINISVLIASSLLIACTTAHAGKHTLAKRKKLFVVAVIDTGFDSERMNKSFICKSGHKDFTGTGLEDHHGHGTHISGLIHQYVTNFILEKNRAFDDLENIKAPYCQIILKYYNPNGLMGDNLIHEVQAFEYAIKMKVDVINFSGGGVATNEKETALVKKALDMGIKVVVAAGNEKSDLSKFEYYPACSDTRSYIVGNLSYSNKRDPSSNYGSKVNTWEYGVDRMSMLPGHSYGRMTGTSQATAIKSGKLIRQMILNSKN